jgi:hypothetical protein
MARRLGRLSAAFGLGIVLMAAPAGADEHDPQRSGHPLRIIAYAVHPVGVIVDTLIFRPAHWVVHREPFRTLFGHTD